jgi:phosphate-selective porin
MRTCEDAIRAIKRHGSDRVRRRTAAVSVVFVALWTLTPVITAGAQAPAPPPALPPTGEVTSTLATVPTARREWWRDVTFESAEHPTLNIGASTRVALRAHLTLDDRRSEAALPDDDTATDVTGSRLGVEGTLLGLFDFQVERELEDEDPWRDVFVNYRQFRAVQVQGGKFKLPFSIDQNTSVTNLDFVYRSLVATHLAPGRDKGVMIHGQTLRRILRYEAGVFQHDGQNAHRQDPDRVSGDRTLAWRVSAKPFRSSDGPLEDLLVGVAMTHSDLHRSTEGLPGLHAHTTLGLDFFDRDIWVKGSRQRRGIEVRWRPGPFGIAGEYIRVTDGRRGQSVEQADLAPLLAHGWYVSGTVVLTGETKADGIRVPRRPLGRGGIGAVELGVRQEAFAFGSAGDDGMPSTSPRARVILGNRDLVTTAGVTWRLNRWVKVQFNAIREQVTDPSQGPRLSDPVFWSRVARLQFTL